MKVFISHSNRNHRRAKRLAVALQGLGLDVWFDEWEILVGHNLADQIYRGITNCEYVLILLTRASIDSKWVKEELDFAKTKEIESGGTRIIPVLIEDCEIPPALRPKVYADFRTSFSKGIDQLSKTLVRACEPAVSKHRDGFFDIELPLLTSRLARNIFFYGLRCQEHPTSQLEKRLRGLSQLVETLTEQAERYRVDPRCYVWLKQYADIYTALSGEAQLSEAKRDEAANLWFEGFPLYCGGIASVLPLNSRVAFEIGRDILEVSDSRVRSAQLRSLRKQLHLSNRFLKLVTEKRPDVDRITAALTIEFRRITDYKILRSYYHKSILVKGLWSGFNCVFAIVLLESGKTQRFCHFFRLCAEFVLSELQDYDTCVAMLHIANRASQSQKGVDVVSATIGDLCSCHQSLIESSQLRSPIGARAFSLGLRLGLIMLNLPEPSLTDLHIIESLATELKLKRAVQASIRNALDDLFYKGPYKSDFVGLIEKISSSFERGESGPSYKNHCDT